MVPFVNAMSGSGFGRRDFIIGAAGAAGLGAGLGSAETAVAQGGPSPASGTPASPPGAGRVSVERRGPVLLIGIDRPQAQNRLDAPIIIGLGKAYYQLDRDEELRVGVLHGVGADFCMGLDVPAFTAAQAAGILPPKDPDIINPLGLRPPFRVKPVVVAVQGGTNAAGHELFLAADIRVAAADATFSQLEVTRGVFPAGGATIRFTREAGWGNAMRYMLTGDRFGAEEAHRLGLVQEVVPPGKQLDRATELAEKIAAAAPLGVRATLASAHQAVAGEDAALLALLPEFQRILKSEDAQEALRAVREGRPPRYQGR
ncbi:MAG TPA: crotonase/enoyl-CoA hydratase family protein [Stellaceae bacterium]